MGRKSSKDISHTEQQELQQRCLPACNGLLDIAQLSMAGNAEPRMVTCAVELPATRTRPLPAPAAAAPAL